MVDKIYKATAHFFSGLFNPFFIPTLAFFVILMNLPGLEMYTLRVKYLLLSIVFISTCILPIVFILTVSLSPGINRNMMSHKDRILPYIFSAFSIFMGAQLIAKLPVPKIFSVFLLGSCLVLLILFAITIKWKISGHGAGMGGLLGAVLALTFKYGINLLWPIIVVILISGAVGSSRIYLKKHTPMQVYAGFSVSVLCMYLTIYFF